MGERNSGRAAGRRFFGFDKDRIMPREIIILACTDCKQRNYNTTKDKRKTPDRLELKKYCRFCGHHTVHRETR